MVDLLGDKFSYQKSLIFGLTEAFHYLTNVSSPTEMRHIKQLEIKKLLEI